MLENIKESYLDKLKKRVAAPRKVFKKHQLLGLELAALLGDDAHRSLYMKLLKYGNEEMIMATARDVATRIAVKNRAGYFMRIIQKDGALKRILAKGKKEVSKPAKTKSKPKTKKTASKTDEKRAG